MFDDQPIKTGGRVPNNLPTAGEPDDIFAKMDSTAAPRPPSPELAEETANPPTLARPSAVSAGILRPKAENQPAPFNGEAGDSPMDQYKLAAPIASRWIIIAIIGLVVVAIAGGAGWWIYRNYIANPSGDLPDAPQYESESGGQAENILPPTSNEGGESELPDLSKEVIDSSILFGEPVDSDEDQLDDELEATAGTDPNNWDSDGDGLGDGEELLVWETNPLNPDTDGDSYPDGTEVLAGYDPKGPGRLLNPPAAAPASS